MKVTLNNQNSHYPIILIPKKIMKYFDMDIEEKEIANFLKISEPKCKAVNSPTFPKRNYIQEKSSIRPNGCLISVFLVPIIIIGIVSARESGLASGIQNAFGWLVIETVFCLIFLRGTLYSVEKKIVEIPIDENKYKLLLKEYETKLSLYNQEFSKAEDIYLKELKKYKATIKENYERVLRILSKNDLRPLLSASRGKNNNIKRGVAELIFLEKANRELEGFIFMDMVPKFGSSNYSYSPDFTLICPNTVLHIDIEIDEPYSLIEKMPIHYIGSSDDERNDFFLQNGWCIIRLTEEQIITNCTECIILIKSVYQSIIELNKHFSTNLISIKRWTYEESLIMLNHRYRERYITLKK